MTSPPICSDPSLKTHPADVITLSRGSEERLPQLPTEWEQDLKNIIKMARMGADVSHSTLQQILRPLKNDPMAIDSQETGGCEENEPLRVLHQILRHVLH